MNAADEGIARIIALGKCEEVADVDEAHVDRAADRLADRRD
jgi:hypothetical protein